MVILKKIYKKLSPIKRIKKSFSIYVGMTGINR